MAKFKKLLITGTGRSGTGYMSELLRSSGVNVGHERVFSWQWARSGGTKHKWMGLKGDSSWMAAPVLHTLPESILVIHVVRAPLSTIRSMTERESLKKGKRNPYFKWLTKNGFVPVPGDTLRSAIALYLWMNEMIEPYAEFRIRVEHVTPHHLHRIADLLGKKPHSLDQYRDRINDLRTDVNKSWNRTKDIIWDDIPKRERRPLMRMALDYGYTIPVD